jgi:hypothetical protein
MSLIMLAPLIGGAIGPAISGAIAQTLGWRQVLVIASSCAFLCEVLFLTCFRETYKMAILRRRIQRIQQESGEFENVTVTSTHENLLKLWRAITRPFVVLFGSAVLVLLALFAAVSFSYFYVMCISLPEVLQNAYNFTPAQAGSAFMSFSKLKHCITLWYIANACHRRRFVSLRHRLQLRPRQDLHQIPRHRECQGHTRIPTAPYNIWWLRASPLYHSVWVGRRKSTSSTIASRLRVPSWVHPPPYHYPSTSLHRRCIRHLLCICYDWSYCHQMSRWYLLAAHYGPSG